MAQALPRLEALDSSGAVVGIAECMEGGAIEPALAVPARGRVSVVRPDTGQTYTGDSIPEGRTFRRWMGGVGDRNFAGPFFLGDVPPSPQDFAGPFTIEGADPVTTLGGWCVSQA